MRRILSGLFLLLSCSGVARADWYPPLKQGLALPELWVTDERGAVSNLKDALVSESHKGPLLLIPVFTKCRMSCPVMVEAVKKATLEFGKTTPTHRPLRIAVLSFDASDKAKDLSNFRKREQISNDWKLFAATDQQAVRTFFDEYSYSIMTDDGGFNHPNQALALSPSLKWVGSVYSTALTEGDVEHAYQAGLDADEVGAFASFKRFLGYPEFWVITGAFGLLLSILFLVLRVGRTHNKSNGLATKS